MLPVEHSNSISSERCIELPTALQEKLAGFRGFVRATKLSEVVMLCVIVSVAMFLTTYAFDRMGETHWGILWVLFCSAIAIWILIPYGVYRWVWCSRSWEQLARLLRSRDCGMGDELLSVIELSSSREEQRRSPELCLAAMRQVAQRAEAQDFRTAAPRHHLKPLGVIGLACGVLVLLLCWLYPAAALNAWHRFSRPWNPANRYTFASVAPLPSSLVVPHGEASTMTVRLLPDSARRPEVARIRMGIPQSSTLQEIEAMIDRPGNHDETDGIPDETLPEAKGGPIGKDSYQFELPALVAAIPMRLTVGDYRQTISVEPRHRPELTELTADVRLPDYLQIGKTANQDVRAGSLSVVEGSSIRLKAIASCDLQNAWIAGSDVPVDGAHFQSEDVRIESDSLEMLLNWQDRYGLTCRQPFVMQVRSTLDEVPSIAAQGLPRQAVVLESEQINFSALAADDFGVQQVGIAWKGLDQSSVVQPAVGEKVIAGGGPEQAAMQIPATFCAAALGIPAQPLEVTLWVKDYSPDHPPVYSAPHLLYVLTPDEHAIWITTQISKWHRSAMDVRDTEMQLFQANQQLRDDTRDASASNQQPLQEAIRRQASLEEANGRKLNSLAQSGADLLRQASRNSDVAVENIQQLAEMLDVLGDIASNRMPSVADLLKQAATQAKAKNNRRVASEDAASSEESQRVGQMRATPQASDAGDEAASDEQVAEDQPSKSPPGASLPAIVDVESNMHSPDALKNSSSASKQPKPSDEAGRIGMVQTTLIGPVAEDKGDQDSSKEPPSPEELAENPPLEKALKEQLELLAEFEKVAEQLNAVLGNLEGSTLVKRLKAASREQILVAEKIASRIESIFGRSKTVSEDDRAVLTSLTESQHQSSQSVSFIMDDMQAYFERRKIPEIKVVLDEMRASDVLAAIKKLGDDLQAEHGLSIALAEFWGDTLDRWAEDLVESSDTKGEESSSESKDSMPPGLVLEMLRLLEGEVNLREETRVAQHASQVLSSEQHQLESTRLSEVQSELRKRTNTLADQIATLPNAEQNFAQEMLLFSTVSQVMEEARMLLTFGNTGSQTTAAQTEVIELLLQSKRINPQGGGGGGGSSPGGGGTGSTEDSALALIGAGLNPNERLETRDVGQGVGKATDRVFPEEFRGGLDAYFQKLEGSQLQYNRSPKP